MIGLLGKKVGMTQIFDEAGQKVPVTVLEVGPCHVTDLRTKEKNGYNAVQLGFDPAKDKNTSRPQKGQFKKAGVSPMRFTREIRTEDLEGLEVGQELKVGNFEVGDWVDIQGVTIGHGYQGVVKKWGMKGAQTKSHGSKHGREPGSTGMSATPSRVLKGRKMPGQMGNVLTTLQNIKVVKIDEENDLLAVKGTVPGSRNGYLVIRAALKKGAERKWKVQGSGSSSAEQSDEAADQDQDVSKEKASQEQQPAPEQPTPKAAEAEQGPNPAEVSDSKS